MHKFCVGLLFCLFVLSLCLNSIIEAQVRPSPYELVEIFRIGHEADGDTIFFRNHEFMEIAVDNTGSIFVGGWNESPVMGFSNQGNFIGFVGSKGEGPGEFKRSDSITIGPEGEIYVFDTDLYRLSSFEPETFQYSHSLSTFNPQELHHAFKLLGISEKGYFFRYVTPYRPTGELGEYVPGETRRGFVNLVNDLGVVELSVVNLPAAEFMVTKYSEDDGSSMNVFPTPFGRRPFFAYKNGIIYAGWNDTIDISLISEDGEVIRTIKRDHEVKPVIRKEIRNQISSRSRRDRRAVMRSELLHETKPAYDALVIDDQGQIWIREYPEYKSDLTKWMILDSDGKLIYEVELPTNVLLKTITGGRAYASIDSEKYGPYIAVYSVKNR